MSRAHVALPHCSVGGEVFMNDQAGMPSVMCLFVSFLSLMFFRSCHESWRSSRLGAGLISLQPHGPTSEWASKMFAHSCLFRTMSRCTGRGM